MNTLSEAGEGIKKLFSKWGVNVETDPRFLEPPCALAMPNYINGARLGKGVLEIEWEVYLIASDTENPLDSLGDILDKIAVHYPLLNINVQSITLINHSPDPLPALSFTLTLEHENEHNRT